MAAKKGEDRASALLKTMGRGSPRQQEQEAVEESTGSTEVPGAPAVTETTEGRERPQRTVRLTVDLDAARHRRIKDFAHKEDSKSTAVMRALLDELDQDPELAARVRDRLAESG